MFKGISKNTWLLHVTVLIWGFTGILGVLINTTALHLVWYRVLIAALSLLAYLLIKKRPIRVTKKQLIQYTLTGGAVGLHWVLLDRKSTRLNSSHVKISYAVFCLK